MTNDFLITLHQFAEKLELSDYSRRSIVDYPALVKQFFAYLAKHEDIHSIKQVTLEHITGYHTWLTYTRHRKERYLSSSTIHARLGALKTFFRIMHSEGMLHEDLSPFIQLPKRKKSLPKNVPSEKVMQQLLDSIQPSDPITTRDRAMLEVLYATGIRNQELRQLVVENIDFIEKTLFVHGKGSKDRIVPLGDWVLPYLREYLEIARPKLINHHNPAEWLFLSKTGHMLTKGNMNDCIRKYARRAGIDTAITPHSFRHACATHLLKAGADIRYVQELLGHADLSSTQIYTRIDISFLKQAHKRYHPREKQEPDEV